MALYGTPDIATQRCGAEIARLRNKRRLSRSRFIMRLYKVIERTDPCYESIGEPWLRRLENGQLVKLQRQTLEALCKALECTVEERNHLLLLADRNVLVHDDSEPDAIAELLNEMMATLHATARATLAGIIDHRGTQDLTNAERQYLITTVLELALKTYRS